MFNRYPGVVSPAFMVVISDVYSGCMPHDIVAFLLGDGQ